MARAPAHARHRDADHDAFVGMDATFARFRRADETRTTCCSRITHVPVRTGSSPHRTDRHRLAPIPSSCANRTTIPLLRIPRRKTRPSHELLHPNRLSFEHQTSRRQCRARRTARWRAERARRRSHASLKLAVVQQQRQSLEPARRKQSSILEYSSAEQSTCWDAAVLEGQVVSTSVLKCKKS